MSNTNLRLVNDALASASEKLTFFQADPKADLIRHSIERIQVHRDKLNDAAKWRPGTRNGPQPIMICGGELCPYSFLDAAVIVTLDVLIPFLQDVFGIGSKQSNSHTHYSPDPALPAQAPPGPKEMVDMLIAYVVVFARLCLIGIVECEAPVTNFRIVRAVGQLDMVLARIVMGMSESLVAAVSSFDTRYLSGLHSNRENAVVILGDSLYRDIDISLTGDKRRLFNDPIAKKHLLVGALGSELLKKLANESARAPVAKITAGPQAATKFGDFGAKIMLFANYIGIAIFALFILKFMIFG